MRLTGKGIYSYRFKVVTYDKEGAKITREFEKDFGDADPSNAEKLALEMWQQKLDAGEPIIQEIETTGPFYMASDWFKLTIKRESGPLLIKD